MSPEAPVLDEPAVELTELGRYLLELRYLLTHDDGSRERPVELFRRVAQNLGEAERRFVDGSSTDEVEGWTSRFLDVMLQRRFLPNAPTLLGAGGPSQQLFACFVLPVDDSVSAVFDTVREAAVVHASGGGTGFSFSRLRERGAAIASGGQSTGPIPFLGIFDAETELIKNGGTGWGANMGVLRVDHPDIDEFVDAKQTGHTLNNFNLSVAVTDEFMAAVRTDGVFAVRDPQSGEPIRERRARPLLDRIAAEAWRTGDPGLLFIDRVNAANPTPQLGPIEATNPCGEAPLLPYEACCLGGINVAAHVVDGALDRHALAATARIAVRMMDNVVEVSRFPLAEIAEAVARTRKLGIGIMGFADACVRLELRYDSTEAVTLAGEVMELVARETHAASVALALERGSFPAFDASTWKAIHPEGMRNATTTSNAPNSTIGPIAGCSPGIEPLFGVVTTRNLADGSKIHEVHPLLVEALEDRNLATDEHLAELIERGSLDECAWAPPELVDLFVTADRVGVDWHVRMQAAFQRHTDLGTSKTINLPSDATVDDVVRAYLLADELGCKGVTVFRDGCLDVQFIERGHRPDSSVDAAHPTDPYCEVCT